MNKEYFINLMKSPFSKDIRGCMKALIKERKISSLKLIMTLVVRDEEDILEKNIRFHYAMGVDGFIVTNHKSQDKTSEILEKLKKEGIVLEVLYKDTPNHQHHVWVNDMIKIAKRKYHADWIINGDADEFYYSKDLNLKESIYEYAKCGINALFIDSTMVFPQDVENFYENKYWGTKIFQEFECEKFNIPKNRKFQEFYTKESCPKILHSTKGFISNTDGNHFIKIRNKKQVRCANIILYHYHVRSYKGFEAKVQRWINSSQYLPGTQGDHVKEMIDMYKQGKLRERFDDFYGEETRNFLTELGMITIDKAVYNFMEWKGII